MIRSVDGRWGKTHFFEKDEFVGKSLFHYGEYKPGETEFVLALACEAGKGRLILDIGANIGAIGQALEHEGYTVASFEPQPEVFRLLGLNVKGEKHNCALGDFEGIAQMPKVHYSERNNFGGLAIGFSSMLGTIDVAVRKLDSFGLDNVGLMKIDVEGFEERVLHGAVETINRCNPILYMEDDRREARAGLHAFLKKLRYTWTEHRPPLYRADNFFGKRKNVWDESYASHNIVCRREQTS